MKITDIIRNLTPGQRQLLSDFYHNRISSHDLEHYADVQHFIDLGLVKTHTTITTAGQAVFETMLEQDGVAAEKT